MYLSNSQADALATQQQDDARPARMFVSMLAGALGVDQTMAGEDNSVDQRAGQYQTVTPYGVSVEGRPVSNLQSAAVTMPLGLIVLGAVVFMVLKK